MKFEIGDETDQALTATLVHELVLCKDSFEWIGCVAVSNEEMEELWRAVPDGTLVVLRP